MKDKQGVVVEGNGKYWEGEKYDDSVAMSKPIMHVTIEGEVHATYYAFAMQQQLNDENNSTFNNSLFCRNPSFTPFLMFFNLSFLVMEWKLVEMQHLGSMPTW